MFKYIFIYSIIYSIFHNKFHLRNFIPNRLVGNQKMYVIVSKRDQTLDKLRNKHNI